MGFPLSETNIWDFYWENNEPYWYLSTFYEEKWVLSTPGSTILPIDIIL